MGGGGSFFLGGGGGGTCGLVGRYVGRVGGGGVGTWAEEEGGSFKWDQIFSN